MNNEIRPKISNRPIRIADIVADAVVDFATNIKVLEFDRQHTSIKLKLNNGMTFSIDWENGKFAFSRPA